MADTNIGEVAEMMRRDLEERIEYAARTYCRLRGLDPDEQVPDRNIPPHIGSLYLTSRWRNEALQIEELVMRLRAIRAAGIDAKEEG